MKFKFNVTFLLVIIISITGCSSSIIRTYSGDPRPKEEISILKAAFNFYAISSVAAKIVTVDGEIINNANEIEILPGKHKITAHLVIFYTSRPLSGKSKTFTINAKPGHTYIVDGNWTGNKIWIEDKNTGLIVAGNKTD